MCTSGLKRSCLRSELGLVAAHFAVVLLLHPGRHWILLWPTWPELPCEWLGPVLHAEVLRAGETLVDGVGTLERLLQLQQRLLLLL